MLRISFPLYTLLNQLRERHPSSIVPDILSECARTDRTDGVTEQTLIDYLDLSASDPGKISYALVSKLPELAASGDVWNGKKRYHAKPAKTMRKLFGDKFTGDQYEQFASLFFTATVKPTDALKFSIVEGEELLHCYNEDNYLPADEADASELHNSCMRAASDNSYMQLYASNPEQIKLAVLRNPKGQVCARSLVWYGMKIDAVRSEVPCYDRIYYTSHECKALMEKSMATFTSIYREPLRLSIYLPEHDCDEWPYIDTMHYSDADGLFSNRSGDYDYRNTDGTRDGDESRYSCEACGCSLDGDVLRITNRGDHYCEGCCTYIERHEDYFLDRYVVFCEDTDQVEHVGDCTEIDGKWYLSENCVETADGDTIHQDDSVITEDDSIWHVCQLDETYVKIEGSYYDIDSSLIVKDRNDEYILKDEAITFEGEIYHQSECITTYEGDTFPEGSAHYLCVDGLNRTRQLTLELA